MTFQEADHAYAVQQLAKNAINKNWRSEAKVKAVKDWACQECGKKMTLKQAERASFSAQGCPKCGGSDIDLASR